MTQLIPRELLSVYRIFCKMYLPWLAEASASNHTRAKLPIGLRLPASVHRGQGEPN
jgi:hypothetical protein